MVLRRKPDVLIGVLPVLRENSKYQGQDKLPVIVWMIAQVSGKQFSTTNGSIWHTKAVSCYFSPLNMLISVSKFSFIGLSRGAGCWVVLVGTQSFANSWWQKLQSTVQGYNFAACGEVWKLWSLPLFFLLRVLLVCDFYFFLVAESCLPQKLVLFWWMVQLERGSGWCHLLHLRLCCDSRSLHLRLE